MTGPDPVDDYEIAAEYDLTKLKVMGIGVIARREKGEPVPCAAFVAVDDHWITLTLTDGRKLELPLDWSARLPHGTPAERNTWKLRLDGAAVIWPSLGEVICVEEALAGIRPNEDQDKLNDWLKERSTANASSDKSRKAG